METKTFDVMNIESPEFLKQLNINELEALCDSIRKFIIENVSKTGGHLSSNLGSVEAIVAMHYVFDSPKDKFLFDVSHQAYTHKILTGRAKNFCDLRKKDGISGFINYKESVHDVFETGHSSTTISAAAGFLEAKELYKDDIGDVIAFIGDGSIQNGLAFEGLNYVGSQNKNQKLILIVNDNEMSISKNVGRMAKRFSKMRIKKGYRLIRNSTPKFIRRAFSRFVGSMKAFVYGGNIFTAMGYKYYGPIDGNNIKEMVAYLKFAKNMDQSVVLHINTKKGLGYDFAMNDKNGTWHGVSPFNVETGKSLAKQNENYISWSKGLSTILEEFIPLHENVKIISPATLVGAEMSDLQNKFPNQIIDVGINEEHAMVMASAMSRNGIKPYVSIYSTFLQRAYDYINNDIARSNNNVTLLIDRCGLIPGDGSTHQGIFDVSFLSPLPNMKIAMPSNLKEAKALIEYSYKNDSPFAIRIPKCETSINTNCDDIAINEPKWLILNEISKVNIITYGEFVNELKDNLEGLGLINALFIKPVDSNILNQLKDTKVIIIEEVVKQGSLASLIMTYNFENNLNLDIISLGIDDYYPEVGSRTELLREARLDKESILEIINKNR